MSMLTEQCAKLRKVAYEVERVKNDTVGMSTHDVLILADTAMRLREAADTIAALRNRLTETCHDTNESPLRFVCSECGGVTSEIAPRYCPCCGRRVVA